MKEKQKIRVTVEALSPLILTAGNQADTFTETGDFLSGSILRGVLAGRYIRANKLGRSAHEDEGFRRLFTGGLKFSAATSQRDGRRALCLPLSLQKHKVSGELSDLAFEKPEMGFKGFKGYGILEDGAIERVEAAKNISLHMSRNTDDKHRTRRGYFPGKERLAGKSTEGGIYNYESILPEQEFCGEISGEPQDLEALLDGLHLAGASFSCQIGKSRFTQYGHCRITFGEAVPLEAEAGGAGFAMQGESLWLRLDAPLLPFMAVARNARETLEEELLGQLMEEADSKDFCIGRIFAASDKASNFVGVWNMHRPAQFALAAGSLFELKKETPWSEKDKAALAAILADGCGARTEEGFGRLRSWTLQNFTLRKAAGREEAQRKAESPRAKTLVAAILRRRIQERIRLKAYEDVEALRTDLSGMTHAFARLETMLGAREKLGEAIGRFRERFRNELREKSPHEKHLRSVKLAGQELRDLLEGRPTVRPPYASLDLGKDVPADLAADVDFKIPDIKTDGEIFYDYWLWFFRHARKRAVQQKKEAAD